MATDSKPDLVTKGVSQRTAELRRDPDLAQHVQRLMRPHRMIRGTAAMITRDDVVNHVATAIALLEANPEIQETADFGGVLVRRDHVTLSGAVGAYQVYLRAVDTFHVSRVGSQVAR